MISFKEEGNRNSIVYDIPVEFNCKVLFMKYKEGGSFFTSFPISDKEFRKSHPGLGRTPSVRVKKGEENTEFTIIDDYGVVYFVIISNNWLSIINGAIEAAREDELLIE